MSNKYPFDLSTFSLEKIQHILQTMDHLPSREELTTLFPAEDVESLLETAYLLRSPANACRLLTALNRSLNE